MAPSHTRGEDSLPWPTHPFTCRGRRLRRRLLCRRHMSQHVSLQISVAPVDLPHAREIVPHQLRQLGGQVDEVLLAVDTQAGSGRFAREWSNRKAGLDAFLVELAGAVGGVRVVPVDYSAPAAQAVADMFFDGRPVPLKDYRGGPFYCYFYALHAAQHDRVLHLDCDMLLGGGSQRWVAEALEILARHPDVLACSPLPGPPSHDGTVNPQHFHTQGAEPDRELPSAFRFDRLSTRAYLVDRVKLAALGGGRFGAHVSEPAAEPASPAAPPRSNLPRWRPTPPQPAPSLPPMPERIVSLEMQRAGLVRLDFLGRDPGLWAVHAWARDADFYELLPGLIDRVERGEVTDDQRGTQELSLGMLRRRRGFRFYRHLPAYRHLLRTR